MTVREGDNCLITRLKSPWNLEIRREFSQQGMVQVNGRHMCFYPKKNKKKIIFQVIRHAETEMEATRTFKRCS